MIPKTNSDLKRAIYDPQTNNFILKIDNIIKQQLKTDNITLSEVFNHILTLKGKKIRSIITMSLADSISMTGYNVLFNVCAIIEMIHMGTLIHDDVVDNSNMRRGQDSINKIWSNKIAILTGDFVLAKTFQLLTFVDNKKLQLAISGICTKLIDGEILQLSKKILSLTDYMNIAKKKTGSLFEISCTAPLFFDKKENKNKIKTAGILGENIGVLFQMADDVIEYKNTNNANDDFKDRNITLPIVLLLDVANMEDKKLIYDYFVLKNDANLLFDDLIKIIEKYKIMKNAAKLIDNYAVICMNLLKEIKSKKILHVIDYIKNSIF